MGAKEGWLWFWFIHIGNYENKWFYMMKYVDI